MALENRHRRLSEQVLEEVKRQIVSGVFPPNTRLSEVELSERLGVSRTPVREALIRLAEDGLLKILPQIGSFVAPISFEAVAQAQFIREHLECAVVADLVKRMDADILRQLRDNLARQAEAAHHGDWSAFYRLDEALHALLSTAAGHSGVWRVILQSKLHLDRVRHLSDRLPAYMELLVLQHTGIVDAIVEGNVAEAQNRLRAHLREVYNTMRRHGIGEETAVPVHEEAAK